MKKCMLFFCAILSVIFCTLFFDVRVFAQEEVIKDGVYAGEISLGGMTEEEAREEIETYVDSLMDLPLTLVVAGKKEVIATPADFGMEWANSDLVREAADLGTTGNIVARYKIKEDLIHENQVYEILFYFDEEMISSFLYEECVPYDIQAVDMNLTGSNGEFTVVEGVEGSTLNVDESLLLLIDYLENTWNEEEDRIELVVETSLPRGTKEELMQIKDLLGGYTTSYRTSSAARSRNITTACEKISGTILYPGDEFSTYELIKPFTPENGYDTAGAYLNGKVIDSVGGGVCQVSTTLYNAVLLSELDVTMRYNHSMVVSYVDLSRDAAISESAGKDFRFVNNLEHPIYIEGFTKDKKITFHIYGVETRDENRTVEYETEIISNTPAGADVIYVDAAQPVGYIATQSAHIGYKAKLWKIVKENGEVVSKEEVNSSRYAMSPRNATVGVATPDLNVYNQVMAAVATGNIDHVKNVIAAVSGARQLEQPVPPLE